MSYNGIGVVNTIAQPLKKKGDHWVGKKEDGA